MFQRLLCYLCSTQGQIQPSIRHALQNKTDKPCLSSLVGVLLKLVRQKLDDCTKEG